MAGLADLLTKQRATMVPVDQPKQLRDLFGAPLRLRPAPSRRQRTVAGVDLHDDDQLQQWIQAHLDAQAASVGEQPQAVTAIAPTVSSRRRYALALMRQRLTPELERGPAKYRRKVAKMLSDLEGVELGL